MPSLVPLDDVEIAYTNGDPPGRAAPWPRRCGRHDFVLHANGDTNREIHLAFLPFLIASKRK